MEGKFLTTGEPILVRNPYTGKNLNFTQFFYILNESFQDDTQQMCEALDNALRKINTSHPSNYNEDTPAINIDLYEMRDAIAGFTNFNNIKGGKK